jgi:predicted ABC-type ATPase
MGGADRPLGNGNDGDRIPGEQLLEHAESVAPNPEPREPRTRQEHADCGRGPAEDLRPAPDTASQRGSNPVDRANQANQQEVPPPGTSQNGTSARPGELPSRLSDSPASSVDSDGRAGPSDEVRSNPGAGADEIDHGNTGQAPEELDHEYEQPASDAGLDRDAGPFRSDSPDQEMPEQTQSNEHSYAESSSPCTSEDRAEHIAEVPDRLGKAEAKEPGAGELHTIDQDREIWSTERTLLHDSLINDMYAQAAEVPCEYKALLTGGLSGAGKSTVLANHPGIDQSQYLTVNPDNMKEEMARRGMIPEVAGLSPMEASDLVHEESSYLARQLALRAQADGKNLIWDITMSDQAKTAQRITELREAGYTRIDGLFVDVPIETSLRRTAARYWADHEKWLAGEGLGGRMIPPDLILSEVDAEWGSSNRKRFESAKPGFDNWEILDNSVDNRQAVLVASSKLSDQPKQSRSTRDEQ